MDPPSTAFFWNRHAPLPSVTLAKLQAFHFPNTKGIKRALCEITIDVSFVMNALCTFILFSNLLRENVKVSMKPPGHFYMQTIKIFIHHPRQLKSLKQELNENV